MNYINTLLYVVCYLILFIVLFRIIYTELCVMFKYVVLEEMPQKNLKVKKL
jgi:hypothetical protein